MSVTEYDTTTDRSPLAWAARTLEQLCERLEQINRDVAEMLEAKRAEK